MIRINSAKNPKEKGDKFKISFQIITTLALLSILLSLITPVNSHSLDSPKEFDIRNRFFSKIQKISNNKLKSDYDQDKGFFCRANDFIKEKEQIMEIPKSMTISPLYLFPFKFEIIQILQEIDIIKNSSNIAHKILYYLFTIEMIILKYSPIKTLKKYIRRHELTDYYDFFEHDPQLFEAFPRSVNSLRYFFPDSTFILSKMNLGFEELKELAIVYDKFNSFGKQYDFIDAIFVPISNFERFKETYALIMSRGVTITLENFYILEGYNENNPNLSDVIKKNNYANRLIASNGAPTMVPYFDLCNHKQPESFKEKNSNFLKLDFKKGKFIGLSGNNWRPGDEYTVNYSTNPSTYVLALNYGFILKKNIFDKTDIKVKDLLPLNMDQINLCKEVGCFPAEANTPSHEFDIRNELINYNQLNENLLNYGRIRTLRENFNSKKISQKLKKNRFISNLNELASNIFYFNVINENLNNEKDNLLEIFNRGSNVKEMIKNSKFNLNIFVQRKNYDELKSREIVYDTAFAIKNILIVHSNKILDTIIQRSNSNVQNIKEKYLDKFK